MVCSAPINFDNPNLGDWYENGINTGEYKFYARRGWVLCDNWEELQEEINRLESCTN